MEFIRYIGTNKREVMQFVASALVKEMNDPAASSVVFRVHNDSTISMMAAPGDFILKTHFGFVLVPMEAAKQIAEALTTTFASAAVAAATDVGKRVRRRVGGF